MYSVTLSYAIDPLIITIKIITSKTWVSHSVSYIFVICSQELRSVGNHVSVIHFRLSCQAIFDFMDYLQKEAPMSRRGDYINTGVSLQLALIMSWVSVGLWILVAIYTARRAYRERDVLTCCGN